MEGYKFWTWFWMTILAGIFYAAMGFIGVLLLFGWKGVMTMLLVDLVLAVYPLYHVWYKPRKERQL